MTPNIDQLNADELEAPQWLDAKFFTKVLQQYENDAQLQVKDVQLTPATVKGDHYASVMFRASVRYTVRRAEHTKSLIIKTMPELEGHKKDMLQESFIFETENDMYAATLPKLEKVLRSIDDQTVFGPCCVYHTLDPKKLIIFEDAVPLGYTVLRDRQANLEEAKAAYLKLAKMHAASYKLSQEEPGCLDKYKHSLMTIPNMTENEFMTSGIGNFINLLEEVPALTQYKKYFEPMRENLIDSCKASFNEYHGDRQEQDTYVLCHGDFHCKNMMFKNDPQTGALQDVLLLDFQLSYMGPQVLDVIYSIFMLLDKEMREQHLDELLHYYFSNFVSTLRKSGFEGRVPNMREFRQQMIRHRLFEIFLLVTFLPMWYAFREGNVDPNEMMESESCRKSMYQNKLFIDELHQILPKYLHLGYFDE